MQIKMYINNRLFAFNTINDKERVLKTAQLWAKLQLRLGEQRIDIVLAAANFEEQKLIEQVARKTGKCL